jgi:hypothetical protein
MLPSFPKQKKRASCIAGATRNSKERCKSDMHFRISNVTYVSRVQTQKENNRRLKYNHPQPCPENIKQMFLRDLK